MPDFVAALAAAALFCMSVLVLNGLTYLALRLHLAPTDLAENGLVQFGLALIVAGAIWRKAVRRARGASAKRGDPVAGSGTRSVT